MHMHCYLLNIHRYDNISVQFSSIPYANLYRYHQEYFIDPIMISEFIENFDNLSSYKLVQIIALYDTFSYCRYPPYLFDAHIYNSILN